MYTGGDILEMTYNHPTVGAGSLFLKANEDGTVDPGGYRSNDDDNMITGDGQFIDQINRSRGSFESPPVAWDMVDKDELEILAKMAGSPLLADWTITSISGAIWGGKGKPVGDIKGITNSANIGLKIAFSGELKRL
ncbi:MAG: hypothetical protein MUP82_10425 [Candidatus Marinimicrobia bacterium]|nr:hypothetical protein [Candidatus Neomarinimicrobiota bacterium]